MAELPDITPLRKSDSSPPWNYDFPSTPLIFVEFSAYINSPCFHFIMVQFAQLLYLLLWDHLWKYPFVFEKHYFIIVICHIWLLKYFLSFCNHHLELRKGRIILGIPFSAEHSKIFFWLSSNVSVLIITY